MVKRPRGSAALVPPCWSSAIWPVFEDQSCNFLFSSVLHGFGRLCQMNATKATFRMILSSLFMLHFFIIKWARHVLIPYQYFYIPLILLCCLALLIPFISLFSSPLCSYCWFPQIALHLIASPFFPPSSSSFLPLPQRGTHLCDRLLLTHSTSAALQMRVERARGESVMQDPENRV